MYNWIGWCEFFYIERYFDNVGVVFFGGFVGIYFKFLIFEDIVCIEIFFSEVFFVLVGGEDIGKWLLKLLYGIGYYIKFFWVKEIKVIVIIFDFIVFMYKVCEVLLEKYLWLDVVSIILILYDVNIDILIILFFLDF